MGYPITAEGIMLSVWRYDVPRTPKFDGGDAKVAYCIVIIQQYPLSFCKWTQISSIRPELPIVNPSRPFTNCIDVIPMSVKLPGLILSTVTKSGGDSGGEAGGSGGDNGGSIGGRATSLQFATTLKSAKSVVALPMEGTICDAASQAGRSTPDTV